MGGSLFTFSTVFSQVLPFIALSLYSTSTTVENKTNTYKMNIALIVQACCWGLSLIAFFRLIKREKWSTFYGLITGAQDAIQVFRSSDDPAMKMNAIFGNHSSFTESIKDEVIAYMHDNWAIWELTRPAWFTPKFIASVGDEFIPGRALQQLNDTAVAEGKAEREKQKPTNLSSIKEIVITLSTVELLSDIYVSAKYQCSEKYEKSNSSNPTKSQL